MGAALSGSSAIDEERASVIVTEDSTGEDTSNGGLVETALS